MSHLSDQQIEQYRLRSLGAEEILAIDDHLFSCAFCFQRFKSAGGQPEPGYISIDLERDDDDDLLYAQVESYVDGALSPTERESFEKHMLECRTCREEVQDLRSFKGALQDDETHATLPAMAATGPGGTGDRGRGTGDGEIAGAVAAGSGVNSRLIWFGAYAALVILASTVIWLLNASQRKQIRTLQEQVEALQQANKALIQRTDQIARLNDRLNKIEESGSALAQSGEEIHDGTRIIRLSGGVLEGLEGVSPDLQMEVKHALDERKARLPSFKELGSRPSVLMGSSPTAGSFSVKHPVGVVIEETEPVFEWDGLDGAVNYTVAIRSEKSKRVVGMSPPITGTRWKPSSPLKRGEVYSWEVRASLAGGGETTAPGPARAFARFKIVSESEERQIEQARKLEPPSHLLTAVLCARAGLVDSGRHEISALQRENPQSAVVRSLLKSVNHLASKQQ